MDGLQVLPNRISIKKEKAEKKDTTFNEVFLKADILFLAIRFLILFQHVKSLGGIAS